jgi:hypothetical protein
MSHIKATFYVIRIGKEMEIGSTRHPKEKELDNLPIR